MKLAAIIILLFLSIKYCHCDKRFMGGVCFALAVVVMASPWILDNLCH